MNRVYIRHENDRKIVLVYDKLQGPIREDRCEDNYDLRNLASYLPLENGFIGVMASSEGPFVFINRDKFFFSDEGWDARLEKGELVNRFCLSKDDVNIVDITYTSPPIDPLDPWSDKESEDLFYWITVHKKNDRGLIREWTEELNWKDIP